ncbi:hypothetical protein BAL199_03374 [alpha proteobacterium BAL199]|jgi:hypothetical protein|nr:hypothetical protein BAL199_03374 [alpha proteobacterium BAL199]
MVTVPETNRLLWEALDAIYTAQRDAAQRTQQALAKLNVEHPEIGQDAMARDVLRAAVTRQDGMRRYADSQMALVETMRAYWEQRASTAEPMPMPLIRRSNPLASAAMAARVATSVGGSD